jgi:hypothetical protein
MFDLSAFDDAAKSAAAAAEKTAPQNNQQTLEQFAAELFKSDAPLVIKSGLQFNSEKVKIALTVKGKKVLDRPSRLKPTEGRHGDSYATEVNKAKFYFRCALIALCAQNKGRISTVDVAALFVGCNLPEYGTLLKSFKAIATDVAKTLNRDVIIGTDYLEIPGIAESPELKVFCKPANSIIAAAKSSVK